MGKLREKPQILFKNSNNTFNTYSKTCSAFSESITKSIIMQLKKKIQNNEYYDDNGIIKRDLSVETDICILRRYLKENKSRMQTKHSSLARFRYSINNTINDAHEESKADTSACGDSEVKIENAQLKVDLTTLVVDNLKSLINDWIKTYLLENNKTKQKIATVLDSILHKIELEQTSSSGTYTLDVEVVNETHTTDTITTNRGDKICLKRNSDRKLSAVTVPLTGRRVKLISTLSVPKTSSKYMKTKSKRTHIQYNKTSVNKLLTNTSSYNVLEIRTESFTKRCATYEEPKWEKNPINQKFDIKPQSSPTAITSINSRDKDNNNNIKKYMQEDFQINNKMYTADKYENEYDANVIQTTQNKPTNISQHIKNKIKHVHNKRKNTKKHPISYPTFESIKRKAFSYNCKKSSMKYRQRNEFLRHIDNICKYFEKSSFVNNVKFDIHINVSPEMLNEDTEDCSGYSHENNTTVLYNVKPKETEITAAFDGMNSINDLPNVANDKSKIISLLDGSLSQTKYIINCETSVKKSNNNIKVGKSIKDQKTGTSGLDIIQDLGEIKQIIKDLISVAENVVKEEMNSKNMKSEIKDPIQPTPKASKKSVAIQCLNTETKNVLISGLKLKMGPKRKDNKEYNPRLTKKITSYRIIESESVLKIHDLTTIPNKIAKSVVDESLQTGPLPKSKSVIDMSPIANNRKLLAFYCDKCIKARPCVYSSCNHNVPCANMYPTCCNNDCRSIGHISIENFHDIDCPENRRQLFKYNNNSCRVTCSQLKCDDVDEETTSVCLDIDRTTCDKKLVVTKRSLGFKEGCFYCTLLWIPVLVIMWLFYVYILKVFIESKRNSEKPAASMIGNSNSSEYPISITDLGF